jgi:KUP system potassium uptake protein
MTTDVVAPAAATTAVNGHGEAHSTAGFKALLIGCIGVVYGDIGTSPLYALREAVVAASGPSGVVTTQAVLGVVSLILWALIIVVTLKYVVILLRADNHGEGGTLALMALAQRAVRHRAGAIVLLGIVSGALFYGDAVITPALSVLSAIEGIKLVTAAFDPYVVPLTVLILLVLFAAQSRGTARVAAFFGPVMTVWFGVIAIAAISPIMRQPEVLLALNPLLAVSFMLHHGIIGFVTLGAVFLAVTGAEALYADPDRLAFHRIAFAGTELSGAGRSRHRRSEGGRESVLPDVSGLGIDSDGRSRHYGDGHREPGRDHRRLFPDAPGHSARPAAEV